MDVLTSPVDLSLALERDHRRAGSSPIRNAAALIAALAALIEAAGPLRHNALEASSQAFLKTTAPSAINLCIIGQKSLLSAATPAERASGLFLDLPASSHERSGGANDNPRRDGILPFD